MGQPIDKITLKGFKSIRELEDFPLRNLNILIGANGAGKSNFVSFFTLPAGGGGRQARSLCSQEGGADDHLFMGPKVTGANLCLPAFSAHRLRIQFGPNSSTIPSCSQMSVSTSIMPAEKHAMISIAKGHRESVLKERLQEGWKILTW